MSALLRRVAALERAKPSDAPAVFVLYSPVHMVTIAGERIDRAGHESEAAFAHRLQRSGKARCVVLASTIDLDL